MNDQKSDTTNLSGQDTMQTNEEEYISPIMLGVSDKLQPNPPTICKNCPKSIWFGNEVEMKCFCMLMHNISWSLEQKDEPITHCDGQILGLMEMNEKE